MPVNIHETLKKYWGYDSFRPLQEDIIHSVLGGNDTLALLPTGGGKSLCFQVPAISSEGMCLVISPLIALMKDQVANLRSRNIQAAAITSGMHKREIDFTLDNAVYGKYKFLYVSPERLQTEMFQARVQKMDINILAVDESHCISQWGYDFRPSYLNIAELREKIPDVPILALTATATPEVVEDIQEKLQFAKSNVLSKSFERPNIAYTVVKEENKLHRILKVREKWGGSGIIYVRSRKRTELFARELQSRNIVAEAYHAGLSGETRDLRQKAWIKGQVEVMVATNAFGMGIDKSDVRWVIHLDLPDTVEAYFQEAGRAGRDEERAMALLLFDDSDISELQRKTKMAFPDRDFVKRVYQAVGNFLQLADGSAKDESYSFNLSAFSKRYNFNPLEVFSALKILQGEGLILLSESMYQPSRLKFLMDKSAFYNLEVNEPKTGRMLNALLRSYSGLLENYTNISEYDVGRRSEMTKVEVIKVLQSLARRNMVDYVPASDQPMLTFTEEKIPVKNLRLSKENYDWRKKRAFDKMQSMIDYSLGDHCRSQFLLNYFGQSDAPECGVCDYCLDKLTPAQNIERIADKILLLLNKGELMVDEVFSFTKAREDQVIQAIEWLEETHQIETNEDRVRRLEN